MNRQESNLALLAILKTLIDSHPDQRFSQILYNYGFVIDGNQEERLASFKEGKWVPIVWRDEYGVESSQILKRVSDTILGQVK